MKKLGASYISISKLVRYCSPRKVQHSWPVRLTTTETWSHACVMSYLHVFEMASVFFSAMKPSKKLLLLMLTSHVEPLRGFCFTWLFIKTCRRSLRLRYQISPREWVVVIIIIVIITFISFYYSALCLNVQIIMVIALSIFLVCTPQ